MAWYQRAARAGRGPARPGPGPRSTRSTTRCPASWRPSWRWRSPPRPPGTTPPPPATSSSCGRWTTSYVSAAFGLARARLRPATGPARSRRSTAVPDASSHHLAAQVAAVRIQIVARRGQAEAAADDLRAAGGRLGRLKLDAALQEQLTAEVLRAALDCVAGRASRWAAAQLLGCEPTERALRFGLERSYRALARLAPDRRAGSSWSTWPTRSARGPGHDRRQGRGRSCPSCGRAVAPGRQLLRGLPGRAGPGRGQRRRAGAGRPVPGLPATRRSPRTATASRAGARCRPAATTSSSISGRWPGSPTAACGTTGTRTRWRSRPPSRPAARSRWRWCATGCPAPPRPDEASLAAAQAAVRVLLAARADRARTCSKPSARPRSPRRSGRVAGAGRAGARRPAVGHLRLRGADRRGRRRVCWLGDSRAYWLADGPVPRPSG